MRTQTSLACWLKAMGVCASVLLLAASPTYAGIVENTESTNWAGALPFGLVTVSNVGAGKVSVSFGDQDPTKPPQGGMVDLVSGGDVSGTPFAGDYVTAGISNIAFKIRAENGTGVIVRVVLGGGPSGGLWTKKVTPPATAGVWITNVVSVSSMDGWSDGKSIYSLPEPSVRWSNDIHNVGFAGIRLTATTTNAQSFMVDSFILVGPNFASAPALLVSLGDALEAAFGVRTYSALTPAQKVVDTDGDGMTDVNEILTGTNPKDRNSIFAAEVVASKTKGITIRWPCMEGCVYTVSRSSDLVTGVFTAVQQGYRLTATNSGYMEFTDTTANADGGPYFYKILKE